MKNTFLIAAILFTASLILSCNDNDINDVAPSNTALDSLGTVTDTVPDTTWVPGGTITVDTIFADTSDVDTTVIRTAHNSRFF